MTGHVVVGPIGELSTGCEAMGAERQPRRTLSGAELEAPAALCPGCGRRSSSLDLFMRWVSAV